MRVVPAILPQPSSSGPDEKPSEPASEPDLEADIRVLEKIVEKWEKVAVVGQEDTLCSRPRRFISSRSFLGQDDRSQTNRSQTQAALTRAIVGLNNVACTSEQGLVGIASPPVLYVDKPMLLSTSYGGRLTRAGWMGPLISLLAATGAICYAGSRAFAETVVTYEAHQELTIHRRSFVSDLFILVSCFFLWFHILQCINRSMCLMLFWYFETNMIVGCQFLACAIYLYNIYITFGRAGLYDIEWQVRNVLLVTFVNMPSSIVMALMDSVRLEHLWLKTVIVTVCLALHIYSFCDARFFCTWWSTQQYVIFGQQIGTTRQLFCSMEFQLCIFLSKMLINCLMGYPWCVIRADYLRPHHFSATVPGNEGLTAAVEKDLAACLQERVSFKTISTPPCRGEEFDVQSIHSVSSHGSLV